MLTYSTEAAFVLALFDLVVSGLPLGTLLWIRFREKKRFRGQGLLLAGFALLSVAFASQAAYHRFAVSPSDGERFHDGLWFAVGGARAAASVVLGAACLRLCGRDASLRLFRFAAAGVLLAALLRVPRELRDGLTTIDPLTSFRLADTAILALATALLGRSPGLRGLSLALLGLGEASGLLGALAPGLAGVAWSVGGLLVLAGLILLALTLERVSDSRLLQYVLRFNLTFVTLAVSLTIALAEIGRRQFIEFAATQSRDVAEFARGRLTYESGQGRPPEEVLAGPALVEGIIREFGRYPDLRRVQLELGDRRMALEIRADGEIAQRFWAGDLPIEPKGTPAEFAEALLLSLPVIVDGRPLGRVSLHHSVVRINGQIGRQMKVAFVVFTLFVVVGSIVTGILVLVADRTILRQDRELAEAQRRLLASERLASIGAVADAVAHEINNPAGVLVARSDYVLSVIGEGPHAAEIREDLDTIRRQAQRIAKTVQDLLGSTRRLRQANVAVDIAAVVDSAIKLVRPVVRDRGVVFEFVPGPGDLRVLGDHDRLEQVLINLLSNAAQAISERGKVTVEASLRPDGKWIDVVVTDTGVGIAPENLGRIFDRFFTTKEPGSGSGLGLSIVSGIVREHGGQIEVTSAVGKGSRFRVALRAYSAGTGRPESTPDRSAASGTDRTRGTVDG